MTTQIHKLRTILNLLEDQRGFDFSGYRFSMLERRIQKRVFSTNCKTIDDYIDFLKRYPEELDHLIDVFTINVSRFFRNSLSFEYIRKITIPELLLTKAKENDTSFRIWSAGCSYGEEAYSIAIILNEIIEKELLSIKPSIFATDIDKNAVKRALEGVYQASSIQNVKYASLKKYFTKKNNQYFISDTIKTMVQFSFYDILDKNRITPPDSIFGGFDVVFCRNLLIYFDLDYQEIIFNKLYNSLKPNGYLILGEAEIPIKSFKDKFRLENKCCKIFKKNG